MDSEKSNGCRFLEIFGSLDYKPRNTSSKQYSNPSGVPFNPGLKNGIPMIPIMDSIIRNVLNSKIPCYYQAA
jgi:hypothetical protein